MKTFVITGGCGFIGQWLARSLIEKGQKVVLFDVKDNASILGDKREKIIFEKGSVEKTDELTTALMRHRPHVLVHYAALLSAAAEAEPERGYSINISPTWAVFDAARKADVGEVLFASSSLAYGDDKAPTMRENTYSPPRTLYGISKVYGEMVGMWHYDRYGMKFAALRYASVIGPGRGEGGVSAYSTLLIETAARGEPYVVRVPERTKLPLVYVKDAVDATLAVQEKMASLKERILNVAGIRKNPTAKQLVEATMKVVPGARITFEPDEANYQMIGASGRDLDDTRLKELGWKPRFGDLNELVADFVAEVRKGTGSDKV